jgi:predicted dehydrogenase
VSAVATRPALGFLGVGWIGRQRLEAIAGSGVADVAAIADPAVEDALGSLDELLDTGVDGIVIATPSALHGEQALAALERGLPVFCQKPLALDASEARRIVEAARAADALLAVDLSYRFTEAARRLRDVVSSGALGEVFAADLVFHNAYGPSATWSSDPALSGGGCVIDLGIHLVDLALWVLGAPAVGRVTSSMHGAPIEDHAEAQIELGAGAVLRLACSWRLHAGRECVLEASFYGTRGGISLRNVDGSFYDFVLERYDGTRAETLAAPPDDWSGRAAVDWARRVAQGDGFDPAVEDVVGVHEVLDLIYGRRP